MASVADAYKVERMRHANPRKLLNINSQILGICE